MEVNDQAADLQARYRLITSDTIAIAAALKWGATGFVENDNTLKKVKEIEYFTMADLD
ncbi:MAG: hypothetical protein NPIRA04_17320 [Nitrospirales bacterium]|nr:MAG: hypothetical protein NPIRA04_17320 [Nitrospirales bacterium]